MDRKVFWVALATMFLTTVRPLPINISLSDALFICSVGLFLFGLLARRGSIQFLLKSPMIMPSALFALGGLISTSQADDPFSSLTVTAKVLFTVTIWLSIFAQIVSDFHHVEVAIGILVVCGVIASGIAIIDASFGTTWGPEISGEVLLPFGRQSGPMGHPNELGYFTALTAQLALGLVVYLRSGHGRALSACAAAMICYGAALSGSLSALAALVCGLIVFACCIGPRGRLIMAVASGSLLILSVVVLPSRFETASVIDRISLDELRNGSPAERWQADVAALGTLSDQPFIGRGLDHSATGSVYATPDYATFSPITDVAIHNTWLETWYTAGLFGAVGFVLMYLQGMRLSLAGLAATRRGSYARFRPLAAALLSATTTWMLMDMAQPHLYHRYTWATVAIAMSLVTRISREKLCPFSPASADPAPV